MSTRIKGRQLMLSIGTPPVEVWADTTSVVLDREEADDDVVTFADAAAGDVQQEYIEIAGIQSTDPTSLWAYCWDNSGQDVAFTYAPHGNATPSTTQPHFVGTCTIGPKPTIGGEAGRTTTFTFETRWDVVGTVTKVTA